MREIKFRGISKHLVIRPGLFVVGYLCESNVISYMDEDYNQIPVDPETIGQYTGLPDKNGKEVYEGDVVKYVFPDGSSYVGVVKWNEKYAAFLVGDSLWDMSTNLNYAEVIGNIHQHPELIESTAKT